MTPQEPEAPAIQETSGAARASQRPRLLVVASTYPATAGDGTPGFVRDLAHAVAEDFDTLVVVPRVPGAATREQDGPVTVARFRYFPRRWEDLAHGAILENLRARRSRWLQVPPFLVAEVLAMRRAVRRHRPDVVHVHWVVPQGVAALVGARGVPWLVTTLGGDVYGLRDPLSRALKSRVLRRAGAVTTMNADMRERLVALGAPPERTSVLPMGADLDSVRAATAGVVPEPGALLFVGRLAEKKGIPVLLEALRRMPADLDWSLDVIGDGPLQHRLEKLAAGLPVRFLGRRGRAELSAALARASVVVVPSVPTASGDQDGLPVALLEAMGSGKAIVASRLPGIDEAIEDGGSGLLVPPGDPDALAAALTRVLTDADLRERLGRAASEAAEDHSVSAVGRRYVEVLRAVAAGR